MNILFIPLTIGLPAIDDSLDKLLVAMETFPNVAVLGDAVSMARVIGLCLALCVGSYECWMMMLGRRGMDVMKLLRIVGISMCISFFFMDLFRFAGARQGTGSRHQSDGTLQEQGGRRLRVEGGSEAERVP